MIGVDSAVCAALNTVKAAANLFDFRSSHLLKRNAELRLPRQDSGEEPFCFVLGNGPSLNQDVLDQISQYPTFTVNFFHKGCRDFNSTYHICVDPAFGDSVNEPEAVEYTQNLIREKKDTKFLLSTKAGKPFLEDHAPLPDNVYLMKCNYSQHGNLLRADMCKPMTMCPNVLPAAIQCAISVGYRRIYLLGCEFGLYGLVGHGHHYQYSVKNEFVPSSNNCLEGLIRCGLVHAHHQAIANYCSKNGITIQNLTPFSNLREYEKNTLDNVIASIEAHTDNAN